MKLAAGGEVAGHGLKKAALSAAVAATERVVVGKVTENATKQAIVHLAESAYQRQFAVILERQLALGISEQVAVQAAEQAAKQSAQRSVAKYVELETTIVAGKQLSARAGMPAGSAPRPRTRASAIPASRLRPPPRAPSGRRAQRHAPAAWPGSRAGSSSASHAIPVIGAVVSGVVDGATTASVGRFAKRVFQPTPTGGEPSAEAEQPSAEAGKPAAAPVWTRLSGLSSWWTKPPAAPGGGGAPEPAAPPAASEMACASDAPPERMPDEQSASAVTDVRSEVAVGAPSQAVALSTEATVQPPRPMPAAATARRCSACGELCERGKFCPQCGSPLDAATVTARAVPPPPPTPPPQSRLPQAQVSSG
jgi:hypothetical protein